MAARKRKSMGEALTETRVSEEAARAFIEAGKPPRLRQEATPGEADALTTEPSSGGGGEASSFAKAPEDRSPRATPGTGDTNSTARRKPGPKPSGVERVTYTFRLLPETVATLQRLAFERRQTGTKPYTQQSIVDEAVARWAESQM